MSTEKTHIRKVCPYCQVAYPINEVHVCKASPDVGVAAVSVSDHLVGALLGDRYAIEQRLSQGGMGVVYKARHAVLDRAVAVKILLKQEDEVALERFVQEAKLASTFNHPNIVYISDFGVLDDGRPYLVMEYLQGPTLGKVLRSGPLSPLRACHIALQIASGLQAVHHRGIIHRDLKPDNIFLLSQAGQEDFVKIVDFGIALAGHRSGPAKSDAPTVKMAAMSKESVQRRYTMPGMVMGTPQYMSPEQAQGTDLDGRSDQYALGCILYEMLSGQLPFDHPSDLSVILRGHVFGQVPPLDLRGPQGMIPEALSALVMRLLAKQPAERFDNMGELSQALERQIKRLRPASDPRGLVQEGGRTTAPTGKVAALFTGWRGGMLAAAAVFFLGGVGIVGYRLLAPVAQTGMLAGEVAALRQSALAELRAQLGSPEAEVRLRAMAALGATHEPSVRQLLEPLLGESNPVIQAHAAEALGQLGERRAAAALRALADQTQSPSVRVAAAGALDQLGDARGQKLLQAELLSPQEESRLRAAFLLCSVAEKEAQSVLRDWLGHSTPPDELLVSALYRLASAGDEGSRSQLLSRLSRGGRLDVQLAAAANLARLGDDRGRAFLHEIARRPGKEQVLAASFLAAVDGSADLDLFRSILDNEDASLAARVAAADGLADAGQSADARPLARLLSHKEARLRLAAASAILELTGRDPSALSEQSLAWAKSSIQDSDWTTRSSAVAALGDTPGKAVPLLSRVLTNDTEPVVRRDAARALARRPEVEALGALRGGLADPSREVRKETLRAIVRLGQRQAPGGAEQVVAEVRPWLKPLLEGKDREEQVLASGTLYQLGDDSQRARLIAWLADTDAVTRGAALEQVGRDRELLVSALKDGTQAVRLTAARKLAGLGDRRASEVLGEAVTAGGVEGLLAYALLRKLGVPATPPTDLAQLLASHDVKTRLAALAATGSLPRSDALPLLLTAAHDSEPAVRQLSAELAAELSGTDGGSELPPGLPVLRSLLGDSDVRVRMRAAALLSRLLKPLAAAGSASTVRRAQPTKLVPTEPTPPESPPDKSADKPPEETADSAVSQYLAGGSEALKRKDYKKAQKLLERALSLCAGKGQSTPQCARLAPEISYQLGASYEAQEQWASAAAEYQKLLAPKGHAAKGKSERQAAAQAALQRISSRLGRLEISKQVGTRCERATVWMEPGLHRVSLGNGQSKMVQVQAHDTVEINTCSPH